MEDTSLSFWVIDGAWLTTRCTACRSCIIHSVYLCIAHHVYLHLVHRASLRVINHAALHISEILSDRRSSITTPGFSAFRSHCLTYKQDSTTGGWDPMEATFTPERSDSEDDELTGRHNATPVWVTSVFCLV